MATTNTTYPCPRCGQERIMSKQWQESPESNSFGQPTHHTLMVCPDKDCQEKLETALAATKAKRQALLQAKEDRQNQSRAAKN